MKLTIEMDHTHFAALTVDSMQWAGHGWHDQPDRFIPYNGGTVVHWRAFKMAHWFDSPASVILAREYLRAVGEPFQILYDEADGDAPYVIITNYGGE